MTPEQINIAIAEIVVPGLRGPYGCFNTPSLTGWVGEEEWVLLDYANDLNACSEFEKTLTRGKEQFDYGNALWDLTGASDPGVNEDIALACATAPQRCRAFLTVKGLWRE